MKRTIRSFVLRGGRISTRQQQGLLQWLKDYEMPMAETVWDFDSVFGRNADTVVEIGFGMGASLLAMASEHPQCNFIGIEVHRAGIGSLAADLHDHAIQNVRIAAHDAVEVFNHHLTDNSLAGIQIFFPDPWPKKKHHKRRLIQPGLVRLLVQKLKVGGFLHCATDWEDYAEHMMAVLSDETGLVNKAGEGCFVPRPETRPLTKFEQRGTRLGHGVRDLIFFKTLGSGLHEQGIVIS
ncbi:tRNA (guanosine(46)-N7)-methyltransferase TrmB [Legionella spiritensis]|uniref:tRNA (guanosine(46)-N7)-methyltransferase TrmB n=1 Tax=Legionella spiritensis TaxID=452 RepID=UPI000F839A3B|nr:tRNA (guanosine(46)-N7)-methyltransferase TrmB [Legionella spiritensis]